MKEETNEEEIRKRNDICEERNEAIEHKDKSLNRLNQSFNTHIEFGEYKKSNLLAYWIKDFAVYHDQERTFDCSKSGVFSRGDVIKVNLGFRIGHELGGVHYCAVWTKYDNLKNGTLIVIPLTSMKNNKKYSLQSVNLGDELYSAFSLNLHKEKEKLNNILEKFDSIPKSIQNDIEKEKRYIKNLEEELSKMKTNSIALVEQITTVSKQRIYNDVLVKKARLSNKSMDLIDENIIKYLTK